MQFISTTEQQRTTTVADLSHAVQDIEETVVETLWSAPDSTGRQYPTQTKATTRRQVSRQRNDRTTTETVETAIAAHADISACETTRRTNDITSTSTEETKTRTPAWLVTFIAGILAIVCIVILLILKRYRIL